MATNPYTYGNLNERWVVGTPTSKAELDKARIRTDANRWTLSQLLADPDDDSSFDLTATSLSLTGALSAGSFSGSITSSNATITGGSITGITDLAIADGGTGASTASAARTNLGLVIGTDVQAYDPELQALSGLTPTDSHFIVGDGTTFVTEDAATARSSLGLRSMAEQNSVAVAITGGTITGLTDLGASFVAITGGSISGITDLAIADGGTGASNAADARTNLGLAIGTDVQAYDPELQALSGLTPTDGNFIVGNGTTFVTESASTARTSLGLGSIATQASNSVSISGGSISGITDLAIADGGTGSSTASGARTNLGLGSLATLSTINNSNWSGTDLAVANGGTGASNAADARTNLGLVIGADVQAYDAELAALSGLTPSSGSFIVGNGSTFVTQSGSTARTTLGLGSMATQNSNGVSISGGSISGITDLAVADGGTGASSASGARTNLGLGSLATASTINNGNWSGTDLSIANGGTGASDAATARTNLGLGTAATYANTNFPTKGGYGNASYYTVNNWIEFLSTTSGLFWSSGGGAGWHVAPSNQADFYFRSGSSGVSRIQFRDNGNTTRGVVAGNSGSGYDSISIETSSNSKLAEFRTSGYTYLYNRTRNEIAAGSDYVASFQNTTSATPYGVIIKDAASPTSGYPLLTVTDSTGSTIYFRVNSSTRATEIGGDTHIHNGTSGNLKVGGSTTALGLEFNYNQSSATTSTIYNNPTYTNASSLLKIGTDGDANPNQLVLKGNGMSGFGTSNPTYELVVSDGSGGKGFEFNVANGTNGGINTLTYNRSTSSYVTANHYAYDHRWYYGSTNAEGMRLTASRELNIYSASNNALNLYASASPAMRFFEGTTERGRIQYVSSSNTLSLYNTERSMDAHFGGADYGLQLDSGSNAKLVLSGSTDPYMRFREGSTDRAYIQWNASGYLTLYNQEAARAIYVGGVPSSLFALQVNGYVDMGGNWLYQGVGAGIYSPAGHYLYSESGRGWQLRSAHSTIAEIKLQKSNGSVLGWYYADGSSQGFLTTSGSWVFRVNQNGGNYLWHKGYARINDGGSFTNPAYPLDVVGSIRATGDVISDSDVRHKSNIQDIHSAMEIVSGMRGVWYDKDGKQSVGVIAQEMEEVLPAVVHTADDEDGTKSVSYGNIVGVLIEAIKEQQQEIDALKARLN